MNMNSILAIEILKNKDVDLLNLKSCFSFYRGNEIAGLEDYNRTKDSRADTLDMEEYCMLMEVLS